MQSPAVPLKNEAKRTEGRRSEKRLRIDLVCLKAGGSVYTLNNMLSKQKPCMNSMGKLRLA